jgi:hypothetical protein
MDCKTTIDGMSVKEWNVVADGAGSEELLAFAQGVHPLLGIHRHQRLQA